MNADALTVDTTSTPGSTIVTNADGTWTKTYTNVYTPSDKSILPSEAYEATILTDIGMGYDGVDWTNIGYAGDIIAGGSGFLDVQTYSKGSINMSNDIYLGTYTHTDTARRNRGALGLQEFSGDIVLNGRITLVENSSIGLEGQTDHTVTINGDTTGSTYTLTTMGLKNTTFNGMVNLGGLETTSSDQVATTQLTFANTTTIGTLTTTNAANLEFAANGKTATINNVTGAGALELTIGEGTTLDIKGGTFALSSFYNAGTLKLNATVTFSDDLWYDVATENGYTLSKRGITLGNVELGANATINGLKGSDYTVTDGVYATSTTDTSTDTRYHVVSGTVKMEDVSTAVTATHTGFVVYANAKLDIAGKKPEGQVLELRGGATLLNSGADISDGTGIDQEQFREISLHGNATVDTTGDMGLVGNGWSQAILDLNGFELTKTGADLFSVANANISAGTINIQNGEFKLISKKVNNGGALNIDSGVKFKLSENGTLSWWNDTSADDDSIVKYDGDFLKNNVSGNGTISIDLHSNSEVVINGAAGGSATESEFQGTISMSSDTLLALGAGYSGGDGYTHAAWALDLSNTTIELNGGGLRFCGNATTIKTLDVNSADTLLYHDSRKNAGDTGLTISTLNLDANLNVTRRWKGDLTITTLQGTGNLNINSGSNELPVHVLSSTTDYSGAISNSAGSVLDLGSAESTVYIQKAIANNGTLNISNLNVVLDNIATTLDGDDAATGVQLSGVRYHYITGSGSVNKTGSIAFTLGGQSITGTVADDSKSVLYGEIYRYNIAAGDSADAATALQARYDENTPVENVNVLGTMSGVSDEAWGSTATTVTGNGTVQVTGQLENKVSPALNGFTGTVLVDGTGENAGRIHLGNNSSQLSGCTIKLTGAPGMAANGSDNRGYITGWGATFSHNIELQGGAINADKDSIWTNVTVDNANEETNTTSYFAVLNSGTGINGNLRLNGGTLKVLNSGTYTMKLGGYVRFDGGVLDLNGTTLDSETKVAHLQVVRNSTGHIKNGTMYVDTLDMRGGDTNPYGGTLQLTDAHLQVSGSNWSHGQGTSILLDGDSSVAHSNTVISHAGRENQGSIVVGSEGVEDGGLNPAPFISKDYVVISNADVKITAGNQTVAARLSGSSITNAGSGTATLTHSENTLTGVYAASGDIILQNVGAELSLNVLEIAAGKSVSAQVTNAADTTAEVQVSSSALLRGGSTLNASLTLNENATLDMSDMTAGAVSIDGALTLGGKVTMGTQLQSILAEMATWETKELVLFDNLDSFVFEEAAVATDTKVLAGTYFSNLTGNSDVYVTYTVNDNVGSLVISTIPEPATATLSLLALAGLAARRRRKH